MLMRNTMPHSSNSHAWTQSLPKLKYKDPSEQDNLTRDSFQPYAESDKKFQNTVRYNFNSSRISNHDKRAESSTFFTVGKSNSKIEIIRHIDSYRAYSSNRMYKGITDFDDQSRLTLVPTEN
jgi:hypothetical protein